MRLAIDTLETQKCYYTTIPESAVKSWKIQQVDFDNKYEHFYYYLKFVKKSRWELIFEYNPLKVGGLDQR